MEYLGTLIFLSNFDIWREIWSLKQGYIGKCCNPRLKCYHLERKCCHPEGKHCTPESSCISFQPCSCLTEIQLLRLCTMLANASRATFKQDMFT